MTKREIIETIVLAVIVLIVSLLLSALDAEAQGGICTWKYIKYWSPAYGCYITEKVPVCTGYLRPRRWRTWR